MEQITQVFRSIGFTKISLTSEEVTEAYARKWGHGLAIRGYIQSSLIYAEKPLTASRGTLGAKIRKRSVRTSSSVRRASLPAVSPTDADQQAPEETGHVSPPGDVAGAPGQEA